MTTSSHESTIKSPDYRLILGQYLCLYSQTPIKRHLILKTVTIYEAVNRQISKRHLQRENDRSVLIPLWLLQLSLLHRQDTR